MTVELRQCIILVVLLRCAVTHHQNHVHTANRGVLGAVCSTPLCMQHEDLAPALHITWPIQQPFITWPLVQWGAVDLVLDLSPFSSYVTHNTSQRCAQSAYRGAIWLVLEGHMVQQLLPGSGLRPRLGP